MACLLGARTGLGRTSSFPDPRFVDWTYGDLPGADLSGGDLFLISQWHFLRGATRALAPSYPCSLRA